MDYGAKGDGKNDDTSAIQKAMDDCYKNDNKGTVELKSGRKFLSFPLKISSSDNIGLTIESGAELIISNDRDKWPDKEDFLEIDDVEYIEISGGGTINGQGEVWWENRDDFRPLTMHMDHCHHVLIKDITVIGCPNHCLELYADNTEVDNIKIINPSSEDKNNPSHNTDGIDVHGDPFYIHDSYISTGDDNVAIHSSNVLIQNCKFGTGHGASIGSLGGGDNLSNITVDRCSFNGTDNGPHIKVQAGAGSGKLSGVKFTNLNLYKVDTAIDISMFYGGGEEDTKFEIDGVEIENLTAKDSKYAGKFDCQESSPCKNIELKDINIEAENGFECQHAHGTASDVDPKSCLES